jgi:hypothetical protein
MASYCTSCGAPMTGAFCVQCGNRAGSPAHSAQPQAPVSQTAPVAKSSAGKILLILVGGFILLGAIGIGSLAYIAYRAKQRIEQVGREYGVDVATGKRTSAPASNAPVGSFPAPSGNDCDELPGKDVAAILGVPVERAESKKDTDGSHLCEYYVSPDARRRIAGEEISTALNRMGNTKRTDDKENLKEGERLVSGAMNVFQNLANANKNGGPDIGLKVFRERGKAMWEKYGELHQGMRSAVGVEMDSPVAGLGDKSYMIPGGLHTFTLKGDTLLVLSFASFAPSREKATALMQRALSGL